MDSNKLIYARVTSDPQSDQFDVVSKFKNLYQAGLIKVPYVASPATGSGPNPWCIDINFLPAFLDIPDFTNFESVTNIRAQEVENHYKNIDGPIVVFWSGGIDSTVILAAILKNFSKHLLERLVVKMTKDSYYENP